jgi:hypothetical protein
MVALELALRQKLPYLIHLGLVEIRVLAEDNAPARQIAKLADVLEFLPRYLEDDGDPDAEREVIREQFDQYRRQFPEAGFGVRALSIIDGLETPSMY